ncbi:DUF4296 domain-containing protein [Aquaticitalea lipolytica]|uniref:DUF4296 domain-containing protein n=1 Tax=Aquaticitalea lipolytica TaxID=1247562 RepID=UPI0024BB32E7|nr:DUF4296 domain-containing protein [Aquaticitalea lipolytica]|tara:strand:+ start:465 stop:905 length:441 start_codon:yes stop_codon:yes gene_type:complete
MRILVFIMYIILFVGCNSVNRPKKPDNLISKDKMSEIIYDVYIMNSAKGINKTLLENNGILPQEFIYKKHSIDSLQFANSNDYYAFDTEVYEGIINKVKEKIESDKAKYEAINEEELKAEKELREARAKELKKSPKVLKEFKEVKQ